MRLAALLVLAFGTLGLTWLANARQRATSETEPSLPEKEFDVASFPRAASSIHRVLDGWSLRHYQERAGEFRREWEVHGESAGMDADENAFVVRPIVLFCEPPPDGKGEPRLVTFHADRGTYAKAAEVVRLAGEVRARSADGSELSAGDLVSSLRKKDLHAAGQVHLRRAGLDLRGTGFASDTQLTDLAFERDVKVEMRTEGGPAVLRPRRAPRAGTGGTPTRTTLDTTTVTCSRAMTFKRLTKPSGPGVPPGPARYEASFEGDVVLLRDVPGAGGSRMSCDRLVAVVVEEEPKTGPARTRIDTLTGRGHVRLEDADGRMECDLLVVERKDDATDVLTLSGRLQRVVVRRTTGGRGLPGTEGGASGPLEATCTGPVVIERDSGTPPETKALFRESVSVSQPGSLVQADEIDLLLLPAEGAMGLSTFAARGHVFLASEAKVALADRLDWDRGTKVTKLTGEPGVEVVQGDRRIRSKEMTLSPGEKGERAVATGDVRIETPDIAASGARLDWDPSRDRMEVTGPPDVVVTQEGSTIQCRSFVLLRSERRMVADGGVWIHFVDDPAKRGRTRAAAPVLPGARTDGGKREADLWCDRTEFLWSEDGGMERMISTGTVTIESGGTRAWGSRFDWDAAGGVGVIEDDPWAVAQSLADPAKPEASPAVFHARRIRFTSTGLLVLSGPKEVRMERDVVDEAGNHAREVVVAVCERDLLIQDRGRELVLERDVHVTTGDASIRCDRMRVFTDPATGRLSRLLAWGRVRYRSADGLALARQMAWEPDTRATDLRALPPAALIDSDGRVFRGEHITIADQGKRFVAENEVRRRDIWLPGSGKK